MVKPIEIKGLTEEEQDKIREKIHRNIAERMKSGIMTEKEVKEIEHMRLKPLPDIQDVQSVYSGLDFED